MAAVPKGWAERKAAEKPKKPKAKKAKVEKSGKEAG